MNSQQFKNNGNQKFPLSTEALEFMQEQIKLVAGLASLAGANIIVKEPTISNGLVIFNGELLPLTGSKNGNTRIAIRVTQETLTVEGFDGNVRTNRVAYYTTTGGTGETKKNISDFTVLKSIATLMSELDDAKLHHMPKGSIIDWYGECLAANVPYGFVPCGIVCKGLGESAVSAEVTAWRNKYPNLITVSSTYSRGWALRITECNGQVVPDLTGRFVVQAGCDYALGDKGGKDSVALNLTEIPEHKHIVPWGEVPSVYSPDWGAPDGYSNKRGAQGNDSDNIWPYTSPVGGNGSGTTVAHENRPPYFALYKLIKVI